jgi:hypothetical protein
MYLENDALSVNGNNVLAFSNSIQWDIHRIQARGATMTGGLYNVSLRGTGYVAVTTKGDPIALDVASSPTFADAQAVVLWTSGVSMDIRVDTGGHRVDDPRRHRRAAADGVRRAGVRAGAAQRVGASGRPPERGPDTRRDARPVHAVTA